MAMELKALYIYIYIYIYCFFYLNSSKARLGLIRYQACQLKCKVLIGIVLAKIVTSVQIRLIKIQDQYNANDLNTKPCKTY